tara:strand:- start:314 stop:1021 length:708 start_codon:yes stop_codon:yes gene_type:complete
MLSIIIPIKNEDEIIHSTLEKIFNELKDINFEIILVDDFSKNNPQNIIKDLISKYENLKFYQNKKEGLGPLIELGIEKSTGDYIVILMADLSDSIEDLKKYHKTISETNFDAVIGSRFIKGSEVIDYPVTKLILNRIFNNFVKLFFLSDYNDFTNAFKIYKKSTLIKLKPYVSESFNIFLELPLKLISRKYKYKIIPIKWKNRKKGKSKFKIKELGAKYIFTLIYCFAEKILLKK